MPGKDDLEQRNVFGELQPALDFFDEEAALEVFSVRQRNNTLRLFNSLCTVPLCFLVLAGSAVKTEHGSEKSESTSTSSLQNRKSNFPRATRLAYRPLSVYPGSESAFRCRQLMSDASTMDSLSG